MRPNAVFWVLPLLLLIAAAGYVRQYEEQLPERIPTHYGPSGPDRWGEKNPRTLYGPLAFGGLVLLNLITLGLAMSKQPQGSAAMDANRRLLLGVCYATGFLFAVFGTAPARNLNGLLVPPWVPIGVLFAVIIGLGVPVFRARSDADASDDAEKNPWRARVFYYNRSNPALVVEKRFGMGVTLNMAHPFAWLFLAETLLLVISGFWLLRG